MSELFESAGAEAVDSALGMALEARAIGAAAGALELAAMGDGVLRAADDAAGKAEGLLQAAGYQPTYSDC